MGFKSVNFAHLAKFNSSTSSELLNFYESFVTDTLREKSAKPKSRTFAPSSFRCDRKNWFRLRGTEPDILESPDVTLNFKAEVGTARHIVIQSNLKAALGEDWIDVGEYLDSISPKFQYNLKQSDLETKIEVSDPPVNFACDGIIRWKGRLYLLEIKTSDYSSWDNLTDPKSVHIDQVKCYCTLLGLHNVLFMYEDRQYGGMKCYEMSVSDSDFKAVMDKFESIQRMAEYNLAPERLPHGDYMCSNCEYQNKCAEWG